MEHPESLPRFRKAAWTLYVAFDDHLTTERAISRHRQDGDAWGELRVVNMIIEHNDQRRVILELVEKAEVDVNDLSALVDQARALVSLVRLDMESEENSLDEQGLVPWSSRDQEDG